jgi:hypothetical protein
MRRISFKDCPYCSSSEVYRSHRKTWGDMASLLCLLEVVRCYGGMRRHLRPVFLPAPKYMPGIDKEKENKAVPIRADDETWKRSA